MIHEIGFFIEGHGIIFCIAILGYMALKIGSKSATKATIILCILAGILLCAGSYIGLIPAIACIAYDIGRSMKKK